MRIIKASLFFVALLFSFLCFSQSDSVFKDIESIRGNFLKVRTLDLSKKRLNNIPSEIFLMRNIECLVLSRNYIREIPDSISLLKRLNYLDLSSNYLDSLPCSLTSLPLDTLIIWDNRIRTFSSCFEVLSQRILYLDNRATQMNKAEQVAIRKIFPKARIRMDYPCNCSR